MSETEAPPPRRGLPVWAVIIAGLVVAAIALHLIFGPR